LLLTIRPTFARSFHRAAYPSVRNRRGSQRRIRTEAVRGIKLRSAIIDIFLQGTNGSDLITALRARMPGLPVIAISGMTALDFLSGTPELSDVVCLQKPFRPPDLMRAIEAAQGLLRQPAGAAAAR
jgi:DNA-binding NtrC family response regulator